MSMQAPTLTWTRDFVVVDGGLPAAQALQSIEESTARWVVIRRNDTPAYLYAFTVDLLRKETAHTQGGSLALAGLAPDWKTLELTVVLACPRVRFFCEERGKVTMRRNAASIPAQITGRVAANAWPGQTITVASTAPTTRAGCRRRCCWRVSRRSSARCGRLLATSPGRCSSRFTARSPPAAAAARRCAQRSSKCAGAFRIRAIGQRFICCGRGSERSSSAGRQGSPAQLRTMGTLQAVGAAARSGVCLPLRTKEIRMAASTARE